MRNPSTQTRVLLTSAVSAVLLVVPAAPSQARPTTTLFGSSVLVAPDETWPEAVDRLDDTFGHARALRMFAGSPTDWSGDKWRYLFTNHNGVVSFRVPPADVLSGAYDDAFRAFFASVPTTRRTWWTYYHEPDVAFQKGELTDLFEYRSAFRRLRYLADETHNPWLRTTVVLVAWTANPRSGMSVEDFWPNSELTDLVAWDDYNGWATGQGFYGDTTSFGVLRDASAALDKPWAIAEFGSQLLPGDDGTGRAAWITALSRFAYDNDAQFCLYYNSNGGPGGADYRLTDAPSQEAWRDVVSDQSPY